MFLHCRFLVDRGEAEALALAQSITDSIILLDDAQARRVAERAHFKVGGGLKQREGRENQTDY